MQLSTREAVKLMGKLKVEFTECKHHARGFITFNGRRLFPIHCSFGSKDLPGNVPHMFRKSLKLNQEEFMVLRSCFLDREAYLRILKAKGYITD